MTRENFHLLQTGLFLKVFTHISASGLVNTCITLKFKCSAGTWFLCGRGFSPELSVFLPEGKHKKALMVWRSSDEQEELH